MSADTAGSQRLIGEPRASVRSAFDRSRVLLKSFMHGNSRRNNARDETIELDKDFSPPLESVSLELSNSGYCAFR